MGNPRPRFLIFRILENCITCSLKSCLPCIGNKSWIPLLHVSVQPKPCIPVQFLYRYQYNEQQYTFVEAFCPVQFPDVFSYPYPGIGLVPPLIAGSLSTSSIPTVAAGGYIASPINPYVGLECENYLYNIQTSKFEPTGNIVCIYPDKPFTELTDLTLISKYFNYITCDGNEDCLGGEDETNEMCGESFL